MRSSSTDPGRSSGILAASLAAAMLTTSTSHAQTISWKGHDWRLTSGGMAGVCQGDPDNVFIDGDGYLHLRISNDGGTWTAAEIFSTTSLGYGTYQWQIDGTVDDYDRNVVVGLFPYGPAAGLGSSGNNEIDIEYARWGNDAWANGNFTVWPPPPTSGAESSTFDFDLGGGTFTTSRFVWSSTEIDFVSMSGFVPVGTRQDVLGSWTYAPANNTARIPQQAMPLGMNLWCFEGVPSDGQEVEMTIRDFTFVPEGEDPPGTGGTGGAGGSGSMGGGGTGGNAGASGGSAGDAGGGREGDTGGSTGGSSGDTGGSTGGRGGDTGGSMGGSGNVTGSGGIEAGGGSGGATGGTSIAGSGGVASTGGTGPGTGGSSSDSTGGFAPTGGMDPRTSGGTAGLSDSSDADATDAESGCSCSVPADPGHAPLPLLSTVALCALALLRSRGPRKPHPSGNRGQS